MDDKVSQDAGPHRTGHEAVLTVLAPAGPTRGVALVLHGGKSHSFDPVQATHLSPARMVPFARHLHAAGRKHGLAAWTLRNSVRGWNGEDMTPLKDARWALAKIRAEHPGVPIYLLGHSMGGLTAICAADEPGVDAVVALAPWLDDGTPSAAVAGRRVLIVHGDADRWTSPSASLRFARRAAAEAAELRYVSLRGAGHFMLRRVWLWHRLATGFLMKAFAERTGLAGEGAPGAGSSAPVPAAAAALDKVLPPSDGSLPALL
ncbi:alpha/beta hydrolase [Arthrobacter sp. NPDC057388]|uniref:alpha/beta hydrolase n=1 Tax=Arthrobacter sp. NPDC057388 TaxID=3346116 RepID=UPI0036381164